MSSDSRLVETIAAALTDDDQEVSLLLASGDFTAACENLAERLVSAGLVWADDCEQVGFYNEGRDAAYFVNMKPVGHFFGSSSDE